jgi:hypothetical protein
MGNRSDIRLLPAESDPKYHIGTLAKFLASAPSYTTSADYRAVGLVSLNYSESNILLETCTLQPLIKEGTCVVIITAQSSLDRVNELTKRKRLCKNGGILSVTTWSDKLEAELKSEQKKTNIGRCLVLCCKPALLSDIQSSVFDE